MVSIVFSCPLISSRVIVIIQARSSCCSVPRNKNTQLLCDAPVCLLCVVLTSEQAGGGFIAGLRRFSARGGRIVPLLRPPIGQQRFQQPGAEREAKVPGLLTAPTWFSVSRKPPPPPPSLSTSNITTMYRNFKSCLGCTQSQDDLKLPR